MTRDDAVAQWLKRRRDEIDPQSCSWWDIDFMLDDYRLHADTGTPLSADVKQS